MPFDPDPPVDAPCLGCGTVQVLAVCDDCRAKYEFLREWPFDQIVHWFLADEADRRFLMGCSPADRQLACDLDRLDALRFPGVYIRR